MLAKRKSSLEAKTSLNIIEATKIKYKYLKISISSIFSGAFTYYADVVVPLGMNVLSSHTQMDFIMQEITKYLNIFGLVIL